MTAVSKVSRRLTQAIAPEVVEHIYKPRLGAELQIVFPYLSALNQAHLVMLARQGIVKPETARGIAEALLRIEADGPSAITPDPLLEDAYFNVEARLIALTSADIGGRLHIARSRNDLSAAIDRLRARGVLLDLMSDANELRRILLDRAELFADVVMPGHTHLQPAQPITFGFYLSGIASALARDVGRLDDAWKRVNLSPMGAAALATTSFPIDRTLVANLLGFDAVLEHGLDCVASRDFALEITALALTLSRFAQDMHVMVSHEFSAVDFPNSVCGTSSIMPQKKNPVVIEHLKGKRRMWRPPSPRQPPAYAPAISRTPWMRIAKGCRWSGEDWSRPAARLRSRASSPAPRSPGPTFCWLARAQTTRRRPIWPTSWFGTAASISARHTMSPARS